MDENTPGKKSGQRSRLRLTGAGILSALHYITALAVVLIFADLLTTNSLHLSRTPELVRQLTEFSNIPSNYRVINVESIKESALSLRNFASGGTVVANSLVIVMLSLNAAMIFLHFFSRRQKNGAAEFAVENGTQNDADSDTKAGGFSHLKALVHNLKNMVTGANTKQSHGGFSTATMERIVHLNLDIETSAKIIKDLENNLTESATQLQVMAKSAMETGNRALSTSIEWNKLTKMLEKQNQLNQNAQFQLKSIRRTVKEVTKIAHNTRQSEQNLVGRSKSIETSVRELSERSEDGDSLVQDMHLNIDTCIHDVRTASNLVKQLSGKAREIVNIISVIDDIAEQTNLLALNASIEAARAGEQGQGFAVVADEVRKLAVRSSTTTRNITNLLQTIQTEAESACEFLGKGEDSISHTSSLFGRLGQHVASDRSTISRCIDEVSSTQNAIRQMTSELTDLTRNCSNVDDHATELAVVQIELITQSDAWLEEIRNSAIATDRIARSLTRKHYKLEHLERLAISNVDIARDAHKLVSQNIGFSGIIRGSTTRLKATADNTEEIGAAVRYVEMLETAVTKLEALQTSRPGTQKNRNQQSPVVGQINDNLHPFEKQVFSDFNADDKPGSKGA